MLIDELIIANPDQGEPPTPRKPMVSHKHISIPQKLKVGSLTHKVARTKFNYDQLVREAVRENSIRISLEKFTSACFRPLIDQVEEAGGGQGCVS